MPAESDAATAISLRPVQHSSGHVMLTQHGENPGLGECVPLAAGDGQQFLVS